MENQRRFFKLLAINLTAGAAVALIAVAGLLALDVDGLRRLIFADEAPLVPLALLVGGFVITFGSAVMGSAIMALGREPPPPAGRARLVPAPRRVSGRA